MTSSNNESTYGAALAGAPPAETLDAADDRMDVGASARLAEMVSQREGLGAAREDEEPSATAGADTAAATSEDGTASEATDKEMPGQETGDEVPPGEMPEGADSEDALPTTERGVKKRIGALLAENRQLQERIRALEEEVQTAAARAVTTGEPRWPEAVAKLKTVAEVEQRQMQVEAQLEALQDFLDENPGGPDTEHEIGGRTVTRRELIARRAALRDELKWLPRRSQAIAAQAERTRARNAMRARVLADFPQMQDPEHPDTRRAQELLRAGWFEGDARADYLALALATGERVLQAELNRRRQRGANPGASGSVAAGKPHVPSAAVRAAAGPPVQSTLKRLKEERSQEALAALLASTGR